MKRTTVLSAQANLAAAPADVDFVLDGDFAEIAELLLDSDGDEIEDGVFADSGVLNTTGTTKAILSDPLASAGSGAARPIPTRRFRLKIAKTGTWTNATYDVTLTQTI